MVFKGQNINKSFPSISITFKICEGDKSKAGTKGSVMPFKFKSRRFEKTAC